MLGPQMNIRKNKVDENFIPRNINELLPKFLTKIENKYKKNPLSIMESWPLIIGPQLAPMTRAVCFENGMLTVIVKNSTLLSLLNNYEKDKLLKKLQEKFSKKNIQKIYFKLG